LSAAPRSPCAGLDALRALLARLPDDPSPAELAALEEAFAALSPLDVGLGRHLARLRGAGPGAEWWSEPLLELPRAHLSLFLLPRGAVLPLHDHPGMRVWTRALEGRLLVEAWDWVAPPPAASARRAGDATLDPGSPALHATPALKNVHALTALDPCAVLDLFAPYYDAEAGRPCRYWEPGPPGPDGACELRLLREE
jgi:cysteamine dioxygenase